jgi:hypothetical protein
MPNDARLGVTLGVLMTLLVGLVLVTRPDDPNISRAQEVLRGIFARSSFDQYLKTWPANTSEPQ